LAASISLSDRAEQNLRLELMPRNCHIVMHAGAVPALANSAEVALMKWQTPKLVEIACGCEINAYFPADL
jgi:coenzyme PQQ precursor peptide PqqA